MKCPTTSNVLFASSWTSSFVIDIVWENGDSSSCIIDTKAPAKAPTKEVVLAVEPLAISNLEVLCNGTFSHMKNINLSILNVHDFENVWHIMKS